jgi:dipeptidase D
MENKVLEYFKEISAIPRCSKNEDKIIKYLIDLSIAKKYSYKVDRAKNVVIAAGNRENSIALQSHVDMVCEKRSDSLHDFAKDPITLIFENDIIRAKDTTLGADNGIGMSIMLALAEDKDILSKTDIELLFTTDEETGLNGAKALKEGFIRSKYMINLDSENDSEIIIGCAGGRDINGCKQIEYKNSGKKTTYEITVDGLFGGHSGIDIDKGRLNAIKVLANILQHIGDIEIINISGGTRHNVIPVSARCVFNSNFSKTEIHKIISLNIQQFRRFEKSIKIEINTLNYISQVIDNQESMATIYTLMALPHGVVEKDRVGVITSSNLARIKIEDNEIFILLSIRSSNFESKENLSTNIFTIFKNSGFECFSENDYPAWQPDYNSHLLSVAKSVYPDESVTVKVVHAGLECGIIKEIYPQLDVISIGPNIKYPHSINENVSISSISKVYNWCKKILLSL